MAGELVLAKTFIEIGYKGFDQIDRYAQQAVQVFQESVKRQSQAYNGSSGQDWVDATFQIKPTKMQSLGSQLKAEFANLGKSIVGAMRPLKEWMDDNMAGAFRKGTSALLDFSRAGSPLAFNTLGASVELLKSRIGSSFGPAILAVSKSIQDLSKWIRDLDPETKKMMVNWAMVAVAGAGLWAMFGNLTVSIAKFGIAVATWAVSNPLLTGLALIAGAAAKAYMEMSKLEKFKAETAENDKRIMSGDITDEDIAGSKNASRIMAIKDPKERQAELEKTQQTLYKQQMAKMAEYDEASGFWNGGAASSLFTGKGSRISGEITALNKEQSILNRIGADTQSGNTTEVKKTKKDSDFSISGMKGLFGSRAGAGSLDSAYNNLNNMALGMDDIQRKILQEQQKSNNEISKNYKATQGIFEILFSAIRQ